MRVFISWSGKKSKAVSIALKDWLPVVINAVEPWLSYSDIEAGARWGNKLSFQLNETKFGIISLTQKSMTSLWVHFEAGAMSRSMDSSKVVPYMLGIEPIDISGPLEQFQAVNGDKEGTRKLVHSLNQAVKTVGEKYLEEKTLDKSFEKWWPDLEQKLNSLPESGEDVEMRTDRELLEEVLLLARSTNRSIGGEAFGEILTPGMINTLLEVYYQRAIEIAKEKGIEPPQKPPTLVTGDYDLMNNERIGKLLQYYSLKAVGIDIKDEFLDL
jgi:hypothetical protein